MPALCKYDSTTIITIIHYYEYIITILKSQLFTMTVRITENTNKNVLRVFIVRHGQTDHNVQKIIQGHLDIDLNDTGKQQAVLAAQAFRYIDIDYIVSSDLIRCQSTLEPFVSDHKITPELTPNLRERYMGAAQGLNVHVAIEKFGHGFREVSEKVEKFTQRIEEEWNLLLKRKELSNVILCTHGGVITNFANYLYNQGYKLSDDLTPEKLKVPFNTSVTVIDIDKETKEGTIQIFGNTDHLGAQLEVKEQELR